MVEPQVVNYIVGQLDKGYSVEDIKKKLAMQGGWSVLEVNEALASIGVGGAGADISSPKPQKAFGASRLLIFFGFIAAVAFGFYVYSFFNKTGAEVVSEMLLNFSKINSMQFEANMSGDMSYEATPPVGSKTVLPTKETTNLTLKFTGTTNVKAEAGGSKKGVFNLTATGLTSSAGPDKRNSIDFELRFIDGTAYALISNAENISVKNLDLLLNRWIRSENGSLEKALGLPSLDGYVIGETSVNKISNLLSRYAILRIKSSTKELMDAASVYHYVFTVDKSEINRAIENMGGTTEGSLSKAEIAYYEALVNSFSVDSFDVWVGVRNALPYKAIFSVSMKESNLLKAGGTIKSTIYFDKFDVSVVVDKPVKTDTMERILYEASLNQVPGTKPSTVKNN